MLDLTVLLMGVTRWHVERFVDLETPGAALDGLVCGLFGEISMILLGSAVSDNAVRVGTHRSMENCIFSL